MPPATSQRRGEPIVAVLLTWFLPGAGHVYLGRATFGLIAFAVVGGVYLLGLKLSAGLAFEFLQDDLRTTFAPVLTPEAGNLGALIWHRRQYPFLAPGAFQPWPSTIKLGATLTAASGVLNMCLMVSAYVDARGGRDESRRPRPSLAVLCAWLVPGLGHWVLGRRFRGALVFTLLVGLFLLGTVLGDGANLDRERHFYYWGGQFLLGLPAILAEWVHGHAPVTGEIQYVDAGLVFGSVAGLLNVLAMLDVFGIAEEQSAADAAGEQGPGSETAEAGA